MLIYNICTLYMTLVKTKIQKMCRKGKLKQSRNRRKLQLHKTFATAQYKKKLHASMILFQPGVYLSLYPFTNSVIEACRVYNVLYICILNIYFPNLPLSIFHRSVEMYCWYDEMLCCNVEASEVIQQLSAPCIHLQDPFWTNRQDVVYHLIHLPFRPDCFAYLVLFVAKMYLQTHTHTLTYVPPQIALSTFTDTKKNYIHFICTDALVACPKTNDKKLSFYSPCMLAANSDLSYKFHATTKSPNLKMNHLNVRLSIDFLATQYA